MKLMTETDAVSGHVPERPSSSKISTASDDCEFFGVAEDPQEEEDEEGPGDDSKSAVRRTNPNKSD